MSKKGQSLNVLGETHLPDDLFTDTDALNWGLDTFPDLGKGLGVLDTQTFGESQHPTSLPDGIVMAEDESFDPNLDLGSDQVIFGSLGDLEDYTKEATLQDLSWLEFAEEDPDRLPDNPVDNGIPELDIAWGVDSRTDGVFLQPNTDREASLYRESLTANVEKTPVAELNSLVKQANRKVAAGFGFSFVAKELATRLGHEAYQAKEAMQKLKADVGLLGKVFIRASDYPGCANGQWTDVVRKKSASAAYVVQKKACGDCVHAQNGSCALFKKELVPSVPWGEALQRYAPSLEASGRKVASNISPKEALQKAILSNPTGMTLVESQRPTHLVAADQIGEKEAREAFAAAAPWEVTAISYGNTRLAAIERKAASIVKDIDKGLRGRALVAHIMRSFNEEDRGIAAVILDPVIKAKNALQETKKTVAHYSGLSNNTQVVAETAEVAWAQLRAIHPPSPIDLEARREAKERQKLLTVLGRWVREGMLSKTAAERLSRSSADSRDVLKVAATLMGKTRIAAYSGLLNTTHVPDVSQAEAWRMLDAAEKQRALVAQRIAATLEKRSLKESQHKKMVALIGKWAKDGLLKKEYANKLVQSSADPHDVLKIAVAMIGRKRMAAYSGASNNTNVPDVPIDEAWRQLAASVALLDRAPSAVYSGIPTSPIQEIPVEQAWAMLAAAEAVEKQVSDRIALTLETRKEASLRAKASQVVGEIKRGLRGSSLLSYIRRIVAKDEVAAMSKLLDPILKKTGALSEVRSERTYEGTVYERAPTEAPKVASGPAYGETERLVRWAKQMMSEGFAGKDLRKLLESRFAPSVRTAATSQIQKLLSTHEGLAGHLYVDADAYASKTGTAGCEKGALKHRANQIPTVLQMSRCGSCSLRTVREDGTSVCSLYNKRLVASAPTENPKAYQAETIRLADGTDADRVAALFENTYDPNDFQLGVEGEMDNLQVSDTPSNEELGDVFFGGMEFE